MHNYSDILKNLKKELGDRVNIRNIISLKILIPTDINFKRLKQILLIKGDKIEVYKRFEHSYLMPTGEQIERSLVYLKYIEAVKYESWGKESKDQSHEQIDDLDDLEEVHEPEIDLSNTPYELKKEEKVEGFWGQWCDEIKKEEHFAHARSTLWSYIVIRTERRPIICSAFLIFSTRIDENNAIIINKLCQDHLYQLITRHYINKILERSLHSAVASIFARNYAHNIGSHVAIRSKNKTIKNRIVELYGKNMDLNASLLSDNTEIDQKKITVQKWVDYIKGRLDDYEIQRNEYLAQTSLPVNNFMFYRDVVLPFVENTLIMDNIAASEDLGYPRKEVNHATYQKGMQPIYNSLRIRVFINGNELCASYTDGQSLKNGLCEDTIDRGEGCWVLESNKEESIICYPNHFPYLIVPRSNFDIDTVYNTKKTGLKNYKNEKDSVKLEDVEVAMPNEHAFYSILENFIRNSAKHNTKRLDDGLEIYIDIRTNSKEFDHHVDDAYYLTLYDNVSCRSQEVIRNLWEGIQMNLLHEDGQTNYENLGLADMKINAHRLYNAEGITEENLKSAMQLVTHPVEAPCEQDGKPKNIFNHLSDSDKLPFIEINNESIQKLSENVKYRFGYRFSLARSKKVCWIGMKANEVLKYQGVYCFNDWDEYENLEIRSIASFEFALLEWNVVEDWNYSDSLKKQEAIERKLLRIPFRVLVNIPISEKEGVYITAGGIEISGILRQLLLSRKVQFVQSQIIFESNEEFPLKLQKLCWESWLRRWGNTKKELILQFQEYNDNWNAEQIIFTTEGCENSLPVVFDHHANWIGNNANAERLSYCYFDKSTIEFSDIFYAKETSLLPYKLLEAGLLKIAVVDERLCADATKSYGVDKLSYLYPIMGNLFQQSNTYLFTTLNDKDFVKTSNKYKLELKVGSEVILPSSISKPDCLIIHRTMLNKPWINIKPEDALLKLKEAFPFVIVISGGGYPHTLGSAIFKYIPLGDLSKLFSRTVSKLHLANILLT